MKNIYLNSKKIAEIINSSIKIGLPPEIPVGIYLVETHGRPSLFRLIEYSCFILRVVLWALIKLPIPNYTLGRFQLGLATILKYYGFDLDIHARIITPTSLQIVYLVRSLIWKNHVNIACHVIKGIYNDCHNLDSDRLIRYVGIKYNGRLKYGLFLEKLVKLHIRKKIQNKLSEVQ